MSFFKTENKTFSNLGSVESELDANILIALHLCESCLGEHDYGSSDIKNMLKALGVKLPLFTPIASRIRALTQSGFIENVLYTSDTSMFAPHAGNALTKLGRGTVEWLINRNNIDFDKLINIAKTCRISPDIY